MKLRIPLMFLAFCAVASAKPAHGYVLRAPDGTPAAVCGTMLLRTDPSRSRPAARVTLPGSYVSPARWFRIHYTTASGSADAVPAADANQNGVPDWVELAASVADSVYANYRALGYTTPLTDGGASGGTEYDIFFINLAPQNVYGYTFSPPDGYMELDNDYAERIYQTKGATGLRITLAHELFHSVQFAVWVGGNDGIWWQEATATFMEEYNYPDINDYWQYLDPDWFCNTLFENPATPLNQGSTGSCDTHMYGAAVFCQYLVRTDSVSGHAGIRYSFDRQKVLRSSAPNVVVDALETTMQQPMRELIAGFWSRAYFTGPRSPRTPFFPDGAAWTSPPPSALLSADWEIKRLGSSGSTQFPVKAAGLGGGIVRIVPDRTAGGVRLTTDATTNWAWRVAVSAGDSVRIIVPRENRVSVSNWDQVEDIVVTFGNGAVTPTESQIMLTAAYDPELTRPAPEEFLLTLEQNRPNPFNPGTEFDFSLSEPAGVTIRVYSVLGIPVRTLVSNAAYGSGLHTGSWDGLDDRGTQVPSGVYILQVTALGRTRSRKMVIVR